MSLPAQHPNSKENRMGNGWAFKLKPGGDLVINRDKGRVCVMGDISSEFVRGMSHPLTDPSFGAAPSNEFEYEFEVKVKATRKKPPFEPGHYRKRGSNPKADVYHFSKPPWELSCYRGSDFAIEANWERVDVTPHE